MTHKRAEGYLTTFKLAFPMGLAFAGEQLLGLVDTAVAGHLGATELAATGLGNALFMAALIIGVGTLSGIEPMTAQARGRQETEFVGRALKSRTTMSILLSPLIILLSEGFLHLYFFIADLAPALQTQMSDYLHARYLCVPFVLHSTVTRSLLQAYEDPRSVFTSMMYVNLINLPLNVYLSTDLSVIILGTEIAGLNMGVVGLGLGTSAVCAFRAFYLRWCFQRHVHMAEFGMNAGDTKRLVRIGLPIGIHWFSEMSIFSVVGLMAGHLGVHEAAAHQVAMTIASFTFTLCLGLSAAGTVRVGLAVGENDADMARREGTRAAVLGLGLMSLTAIGLYVGRYMLSGIFTNEGNVLDLAVPLLVIASTFQLVDGVQAVMAGNLRGLGATRWALFCSAFGYWCVGFPAAFYFSQSQGLEGLWWGLVVGLFVSALLQTIGFYRNLNPGPFSTLRKLLD